jgi:hypothetical protein
MLKSNLKNGQILETNGGDHFTVALNGLNRKLRDGSYFRISGQFIVNIRNTDHMIPLCCYSEWLENYGSHNLSIKKILNEEEKRDVYNSLQTNYGKNAKQEDTEKVLGE